MAQIDKLLVMGCVIRVFQDAAGNMSYTLWSADYKIEIQYIHASTFDRYKSRLYLLSETHIQTGEKYAFYRLVREQ